MTGEGNWSWRNWRKGTGAGETEVEAGVRGLEEGNWGTGGRELEEGSWSWGKGTGGRELAEDDWRRELGGRELEEGNWRKTTGGKETWKNWGEGIWDYKPYKKSAPAAGKFLIFPKLPPAAGKSLSS